MSSYNPPNDPEIKSDPPVAPQEPPAHVPIIPAIDQETPAPSYQDGGAYPGTETTSPAQPVEKVKTDTTVEEETALLMAILIASVFEFIAAARVCDQLKDAGLKCESEEAWAVACGVVSSVVVAILLVIKMRKPDQVERINKIAAPCLFIWWLFGVGACTFYSPFKQTGNGYFASWIGFLASIKLVIVSQPRLRALTAVGQAKIDEAQAETQWILIVLLGTIIECIDALVECFKKDNCKGEYGWAISVGIISAFLCLVFLVFGKRMSPQVVKGFSILLLLLWSFGTGVLTFDKPFTTTGNGYFGCWFAMIGSLLFALEAAGHSLSVDKKSM